MCGFVGIYNYHSTALVIADDLTRMRDSMIHRGPDSAGIWIANDGKIGFAHRRLAIIDLSHKANQPMQDEDERISIVFSGEIYNHSELRTELNSRGYAFRTDHSDTEVIIHAFKCWGIGFIRRLRGEFAFALWDNKRKELWLVRDRIGVKPLYYMEAKGGFWFASEVNALLLEHASARRIAPQSIYHYLTLLCVPAPDTMFKDIHKLPAGSWLRVNALGQYTTTQYWNAAEYLNNPLDEDEESAVKHTENLVSEAVRYRLNSEVGIAATLSGGIDTSLIAAMMKQSKPDVLTVTMDYEIESPYSESAAAREIANELGVDVSTYRVCADEFLLAFDNYLEIQSDYPPGAQDVILFFLLSRYLKSSGVSVCIVGEGADELGGYPSYFDLQAEFNRLRHFANLPQWVKRAVYGVSSFSAKRELGIALGHSVISRKHIQSFTEEEKRDLWLDHDMASSYHVVESIMGEINVDRSDEFLRKVANVEFKLRLPEFMLPRIDYPAMAHSLEVRVPFLDHKLVEYSLRLPMKLKMRNGQAKYIFKKILAKYIDERHIYRKKVGFGRVLTPFLDDVLPQCFDTQILSRKDHPLYSFVRRSYAKNLYYQHCNGRKNGFKIWTLYALAKWLELHQP